MKAEVAAYVERVRRSARRQRPPAGGPQRLSPAAGRADRRGCGVGAAPRVNDKRVDPDSGERQRFSSAILPAWARKSPQMTEVLPLLYLHGLSSGDFGPALEQFLGTGAGLSAASITRLTAQWQDEAKAFGQRDLSGTDYVYLWVDGIHLKVRLEQEKLCLLVMIGVRADGRKELVALTDGYPGVDRVVGRSVARLPPPRDDRPSAGGRGRRARFLEGDARGVPSHPRAAVLVAQAGQRPCCAAEISASGRDRGDARTSTTPRTSTRPSSRSRRSRSTTAPSTPRRSPRSPTTSTCCWSSTSTRPSTGSTCAPPTRSKVTFATVRLRTKVTKGPGSRAAGMAMAYKLIDAAQARWRAVNAPHLVALVRAGAVFHKGKLLERPIDITPDTNAGRKRGIGGRLKLTNPQVLTISEFGSTNNSIRDT